MFVACTKVRSSTTRLEFICALFSTINNAEKWRIEQIKDSDVLECTITYITVDRGMSRDIGYADASGYDIDIT